MNRLHPLPFFVCIALITVISAACADPIVSVIILITGLIAARLSGAGRLWIYAAVILAVTVINPFFSHRGNTVLFFLNDSPFTLEAVLAGLSSGVRLAGTLLWFAAYSRVMTSDKHLYLFSAFTPRLGVTLGAALRFTPLLIRRYREISMAQRAMGLYSSTALSDRLKSSLLAFSSSFDWAIENGVISAISMRARGYGSGRRSSYTLFRFSAGSTALIVFSVICAAVVLINLGELRFVFYPEPSAVSETVAPRLAILALCAILPVAELKERFVWKFSASKISALPTEGQTTQL
ncbi:MAG: hypothetical protein J1F63_00040 [Oscillospiraceae bacterium]|nr:hypothetical protein [Oscillospiraceae bacterium]